LHPANRQQLAGWINFVKQNQRIAVSPYLMEAASSVGPKANQAVMAVDLAYVLDPAGVNGRLRNCRTLAGQKVDFDALTRLCVGLRGVTVAVRVDEAINGQLRADFSAPADVLQPFAKDLFMEAMDRMGMHVDDLEKWRGRAEGSSLILEGELTIPGARQLFSPLLTPGSNIQARMESSPGQQQLENQQNPAAVASLRYFKSVGTLLDELQKSKVKTYKNMIYTLNKYADAIDELPILNVDDALLNYGQSMSATIRNMGQTALGSLQAQQFLEANKTEGLVSTGGYAGVSGPYGGYAYGYVPGALTISSNAGTLGNIQGVQAAQERQMRAQTWNNINEATSLLRRQMTQKYQVEF
jgi:hypothetical protein